MPRIRDHRNVPTEPAGLMLVCFGLGPLSLSNRALKKPGEQAAAKHKGTKGSSNVALFRALWTTYLVVFRVSFRS